MSPNLCEFEAREHVAMRFAIRISRSKRVQMHRRFSTLLATLLIASTQVSLVGCGSHSKERASSEPPVGAKSPHVALNALPGIRSAEVEEQNLSPAASEFPDQMPDDLASDSRQVIPADPQEAENLANDRGDEATTIAPSPVEVADRKGEPAPDKQKRGVAAGPQDDGKPHLDRLNAADTDLSGEWQGLTVSGWYYSTLVIKKIGKATDEYHVLFKLNADFGSGDEKRTGTFKNGVLRLNRHIDGFGGTDAPY